MVQKEEQAPLSRSDRKVGFAFPLSFLKYIWGLVHVNTETMRLSYTEQT